MSQETRKEALSKITSSAHNILSGVKTNIELTENEIEALMKIPSAESLRDITEYFTDYDKLMAGRLNFQTKRFFRR